MADPKRTLSWRLAQIRRARWLALADHLEAYVARWNRNQAIIDGLRAVAKAEPPK